MPAKGSPEKAGSVSNDAFAVLLRYAEFSGQKASCGTLHTIAPVKLTPIK